MLKYIFKIFFVFILFYSCDDIPRDNPLDPQNPSSYRSKIILVEAFVNTSDSLPYQYNQDMLTVLDLLEEEYQDKITILEYHRNTGTDFEYKDDYHLNENEFLYDKYMDLHGGIKGVPDVFIDVTKRIQGISSIENASVFMEKELQPLLMEDGYFTIEPSVSKRPDEINIHATVARLGYQSVRDILVKAIVIEKINNQFLKRVVRKTVYSDVINHFAHGEVNDITFEPVEVNQEWGANLKIVIVISSEDELKIYQSIEVEI